MIPVLSHPTDEETETQGSWGMVPTPHSKWQSWDAGWGQSHFQVLREIRSDVGTKSLSPSSMKWFYAPFSFCSTIILLRVRVGGQGRLLEGDMTWAGALRISKKQGEQFQQSWPPGVRSLSQGGKWVAWIRWELWSQTAWVYIWALPLISRVTLGISLNLSDSIPVIWGL